MAKDLNKVMLTGRLGADPEMKYTAQGSAVTQFSVASGRTWKSADGQQHEDTEWFRVVAWDKLGEICNQYLNKGTRVYVEGRLQTRKWQGQDGQNRYTTEVIANDMIILSSKQESLAGATDNDYEAPADDEAPPAPPVNRRTPTPAPQRAASGNANGGSTNGGSRPAAPSRPATRNAPQPLENDEDLPF